MRVLITISKKSVILFIKLQTQVYLWVLIKAKSIFPTKHQAWLLDCHLRLFIVLIIHIWEFLFYSGTKILIFYATYLHRTLKSNFFLIYINFLCVCAERLRRHFLTLHHQFKAIAKWWSNPSYFEWYNEHIER